MKSKKMMMAVGMLSCCLVPLIIVLAVSGLGIASGSRILGYITPLLCPIMMVGMMFFMGRGKGGHNHDGHSCCHGAQEESNK